MYVSLLGWLALCRPHRLDVFMYAADNGARRACCDDLTLFTTLIGQRCSPSCGNDFALFTAPSAAYSRHHALSCRHTRAQCCSCCCRVYFPPVDDTKYPFYLAGEWGMPAVQNISVASSMHHGLCFCLPVQLLYRHTRGTLIGQRCSLFAVTMLLYSQTTYAAYFRRHVLFYRHISHA